MKERIVTLILLLLTGLTIWALTAELPKKHYARPAADFTDAVRNGATATSPVTTEVAEEVIRLHILADSDSEQDQAIKLALRDVLLPYLNAATTNAESKAEALSRLCSLCPALTDIANRALKQLNAEYTATVSVERLYFPIRIYGSQTYLSEDAIIFPPGFYDSVRVVLGSGKGHNWWCLAYPSLCYIDSAYDYVPKDSRLYKLKIGSVKKETLAKIFYGEQPDTDSDKIDLYAGFKLWELIKTVFQEK